VLSQSAELAVFRPNSWPHSEMQCASSMAKHVTGTCRNQRTARWDQNDYYQLRSDGLPFTPEDVRLIRSGMARQAAQLASSESGPKVIAPN
jgi:hypothetical protein